MIKVGVVGYGTVGKRVADAVALQDDMELVGVTARSYNQRILSAEKKGLPIYAAGDATALAEYGIAVKGSLADLLDSVDIVVDCTPSPCGEENLALYKQHGVKAILQGGESAGCVECSFNAQSNYGEALDKNYVRVVSCNTTALSRVLGALKDKLGHVSITLMRRSMDPGQKGKTVMNAVEPSFQFPSHHGPDVNTIIPDIDIFSVAFKVPSTLMHVHSIEAELKEPMMTEQALDVLRNTTRVHVINGNSEITSTAHVMELGKDLGRTRGDFMEAAVWEKGVKVVGKKLYVMLAVHQESIIVPENIDCIRAMTGFTDAERSIQKTNKSLGL